MFHGNEVVLLVLKDLDKLKGVLWYVCFLVYHRFKGFVEEDCAVFSCPVDAGYDRSKWVTYLVSLRVEVDAREPGMLSVWSSVFDEFGFLCFIESAVCDLGFDFVVLIDDFIGDLFVGARFNESVVDGVAELVEGFLIVLLLVHNDQFVSFVCFLDDYESIFLHLVQSLNVRKVCVNLLVISVLTCDECFDVGFDAGHVVVYFGSCCYGDLLRFLEVFFHVVVSFNPSVVLVT